MSALTSRIFGERTCLRLKARSCEVSAPPRAAERRILLGVMARGRLRPERLDQELAVAHDGGQELLKSCATPPARRPMASSSCDWRSWSSSCLRWVMSCENASTQVARAGPSAPVVRFRSSGPTSTERHLEVPFTTWLLAMAATQAATIFWSRHKSARLERDRGPFRKRTRARQEGRVDLEVATLMQSSASTLIASGLAWKTLRKRFPTVAALLASGVSSVMSRIAVIRASWPPSRTVLPETFGPELAAVLAHGDDLVGALVSVSMWRL